MLVDNVFRQFEYTFRIVFVQKRKVLGVIFIPLDFEYMTLELVDIWYHTLFGWLDEIGRVGLSLWTKALNSLTPSDKRVCITNNNNKNTNTNNKTPIDYLVKWIQSQQGLDEILSSVR